MPGDRGNFVGVQAKIQAVKDASGAGYAEKRLEMGGMIPHHRRDAVAGLQAKLGEGRGEAAGATIKGAVGGSHQRAIRADGNNFDASEKAPGTLKQRGNRQRKIHHGAAHQSLTDRVGSPIDRLRRILPLFRAVVQR